MTNARYIYARVHAYDVCARNCHAYSVNAMCDWCECVCVCVCVCAVQV